MISILEQGYVTHWLPRNGDYGAPERSDDHVTSIHTRYMSDFGLAYLSQSQSMAQQITAYGRLLSHLDNHRRILVLAFDEAAATVFQLFCRAMRLCCPVILAISVRCQIYTSKTGHYPAKAWINLQGCQVKFDGFECSAKTMLNVLVPARW
jgi:hypothetical protein